MLDITELQVNIETFSQLPARLKYNNTIAEYYYRLADEDDNLHDSLTEKANRLLGCSNTWDIVWHRLQATKGLKNAHLCRDLFCVNCMSARADKRETKYGPMLKSLSKDYAIYHCVFTVKNCSDVMLKYTIKKMYDSFYNICRYFTGRAGLRYYDFSYLGLVGGIRNLEVSYNEQSNTYHPHLHCMLVLSKDLELHKHNTNAFSFSNTDDDVVYFSDEEILFQKIWYLLNTGQKVTRKNVESVTLGYDVQFNKASPEDYKEVFKYAFKADLDQDKLFGYEQFKTYYKALKDVRFIQGFGCLRKFTFDDEELTFEDLDIAYHEFVAQLDEIEEPVAISENYAEILDNMERKRYRYYTKGSFKKFYLDYSESRLTPESVEILRKFRDKNNKK